MKKLVNEVEDLDSIRSELEVDSISTRQREDAGFSISKRAVKRRKSKPTGGGKCVDSTRRKRRQNMLAAANAIHGGSDENLRPGTIGMLETLDRKCKVGDIVHGLAKCEKFKKKVFPRLYKEDLDQYEHSSDNMLRSVAVYYSKGIMGKDKYRQVYKTTSYKHATGQKRAARIQVSNCPSPRLVPYHRLMAYIKCIDVGQLYSVRDTLCDGLNECDKVNGCYRDIEDLLVRMATFYLSDGKYTILTFDQRNTFHVALGGDGAPFGKHDSACSWLVSFLDIGQGVLSSSDNFLLFGANCSESCIPVKRFLGKLMDDIHRIQKSTYSIVVNEEHVDVKFVFAELPNDMKMLAFLAGELTNSATYFSTFADVHNESMLLSTGTFGRQDSDTWQPWNYSHRIATVKKVDNFKEIISHKKVSAKTKRANITGFIAKQKSRQEFVPLVGELIDRAHVEPLHLKNNACALAHRYLLNQAIEMSKPHLSTCLSFTQVPPDTPFSRYIDILRSKCNLSRLAKKVIRWYDENASSNRKSFDYRFTGKDSRMFLHNFMFLIDALESGASSKATELLHVHAYLCLCLRNAVSLFSRVNITDEQIQELKQHCTNLYRGYYLFLQVNPTIWTLGCVVPVHAQEMKQIYSLGLGLNSMEGREAKHVAISKYCANTAYMHRWEQVFRHEYISLIWLRVHGCTNGMSVTSTGNKTLFPKPKSYVPKRVLSGDPNICTCGLQKQVPCDLCRFCGHSLRKKIEESIKECKLLL